MTPFLKLIKNCKFRENLFGFIELNLISVKLHNTLSMQNTYLG